MTGRRPDRQVLLMVSTHHWQAPHAPEVAADNVHGRLQEIGGVTAVAAGSGHGRDRLEAEERLVQRDRAIHQLQLRRRSRPVAAGARH